MFSLSLSLLYDFVFLSYALEDGPDETLADGRKKKGMDKK